MDQIIEIHVNRQILMHPDGDCLNQGQVFQDDPIPPSPSLPPTKRTVCRVDFARFIRFFSTTRASEAGLISSDSGVLESSNVAVHFPRPAELNKLFKALAMFSPINACSGTSNAAVVKLVAYRTAATTTLS